MTNFLFPPAQFPTLPIVGQDKVFPVNRIFCVGRNYEAHAKEMGNEVDREAPFYFTKAPHAVLHTGGVLPYPPGTSNFHHEMEFVIAIGKPAFRVSVENAQEVVFGYGSGLDMTRRDLQNVAKEKRRPWDLGKDLEGGAVLGPLTPASDMGQISDQRIWLEINGEIRQDATLAEMIHNVAEVIADLSKYYHLVPGDLIMTGTPAGVSAVEPGDLLEGSIDGLEPVRVEIGAPE